MHNVHEYLEDILRNGVRSEDRTGVGTISVFGRMMRWDLSQGFPAITTKKLAWRAVVGELLWFLRGDMRVTTLKEIMFGDPNSERRTIWCDNYENQGKALGYVDGYLGPIYGQQWRDFNDTGIDQIKRLVHDLKAHPYSRRHIVTAWNPEQLDEMALPPCHYGFQCYVREGKLSLMWTQRSADSFLGTPFNIASYALLVHILCELTGLEPGELVFNGGDCHIYTNHLNAVDEMLSREEYDLPTLKINARLNHLSDLDLCSINDFELLGYQHHPTIKAPMAV